VLEQLFLHQAGTNKWEGGMETEFYKTYLFLKDICANGFMPNYLVSYAFSYFKKLRNDAAIKRRKFKDDAVAAFALYETMSRHEIPRTVNEIEYVTGVPSNQLFSIEGCLHFSDTLNNPQDFVERYCSQLANITYFDIKIIKGIVGNMYGMGDVRPNTIVAAIIYLYCKEVDLKQSIKTICEVCGVSSYNVYKIVRNLRSDFSHQISLLYT